MKEKPAVKIKIARPTVVNGKVVNKGTVLTMLESEAKQYLRTGKAVIAGNQEKEEKGK